MTKKNTKIVLIVGAICFTLWFSVLFWKKWDKPLTSVLERELISQVIVQASHKLQRRFELGDFEKHLVAKPNDCLEYLGPLEHVSAHTLQCNPNFLQCFFEKKWDKDHGQLKVEHLGKSYIVQLKQSFPPLDFYSPQKRFYQYISKATHEYVWPISHGPFFYLYEKNRPESEMGVLLDGNCHQSYLPQRVYGQVKDLSVQYHKSIWKKRGEKKANLDYYRWDNFFSHIYIDKYLVTFGQVVHWAESFNIKLNNKFIKNKKTLGLPASGLTEKEMKLYCAYQGKQLMMAHYYDAASFYPPDIEKTRPIKLKFYPYPWTRKEKESFLYDSQKNASTIKLKKDDCAKAFIKGCQEIFPYGQYLEESSSWMGMNQILGGPMEALKNAKDEQFNLKISSYYLDSTHPWNILGKRQMWNGEGNTKDDLVNLDTNEAAWAALDSESFDIGFRCMSYKNE